MKKIIQKIKKFPTLILLVLSVGLIAPNKAHALFGYSWTGFLEAGVNFVVWLFNSILGIFVNLAGSLVGFTLDMNIHLLGPNNNLINEGWQITRDVANLGFVLAIIVIAVMIIVRYNEQSTKKLLPKLVLAAILVNFSMAIAMPIINVSNDLTSFFTIEQLGDTNADIGSVITGAFSPQEFWTQNQYDPGDNNQPDFGDEESTGGPLAALAGVAMAGIFNIVFTLLLTFVLAALAIMLLIRFVWLSFLLILAPLAWLFWVFPGQAGHFKKWWDNFIKWSIFAPAMGFFIYLSLMAADSLSGNTQMISKNIDSEALAAVAVNGSHMLIVGGFLIGGLLAAQELGIKSAGTAIDMASKAKDKTRDYFKEGARQRALTAGAGGEGEDDRSYAEKAASRASKIPVIGRAFRGTAESITKQRKELKDSVEDRQKSLSNLTEKDIGQRAKSARALRNPVEGAGIAAAMADKGLTSKEKREELGITDKRFDKLLKNVIQTKSEKTVLKSRPDLAVELDKDSITKVMQKSKSSDANEIDKEALKDPEVTINLSNGHLAKIGAEGNAQQKQAIYEIVEKFENGTIDQQTIQEIEENLGEGETIQGNLNRMKKFMKRNTNWQAEGEGGGSKPDNELSNEEWEDKYGDMV